MTTFNADIHSPAATAPTTTGRVAHCKVCGIEWQIQSEDDTDAKGCDFCGSDSSAITINNEDNNHPIVIKIGL